MQTFTIPTSGSAMGFWEVLADRCGNALAATLQQWRGTSVLALGDSFGVDNQRGKSWQAVQRLRRLNPALRVSNHCFPSQGLLDAGSLARRFSRRGFDAAIVFVGETELADLEAHDDFLEAADAALASIARVARRTFLVTAFDAEAFDPAAPEAGIAARRRRWLERNLHELCARHRIAWIPLVSEEGCLPSAQLASLNFSVDGFRPGHDPHEMWTARMLEQPALAQLVFH